MRAWLAENVTFPNAMVDRIVPGPTDDTKAAVERILGVADACPVPAERFTMWVIQDHFAAGRPKWEAGGAIFTEEVEKYELVKLRLLNGSHSLIAYLGGLAGQPTIPSSFGQDFVRECVTELLNVEYLPSIDLPSGFDPQAYIAQLFDRWSNHALGDATARVGSDGSLKLLQRVPDPALRLLNLGEMPQQLALMVAGWIACVAPPEGFDPGPIAAAMIEPAKEKLAAVTTGAGSVRAHVEKIMRGGFFPEALAQRIALRPLHAHLHQRVQHGIHALLLEAVDPAEQAFHHRAGQPDRRRGKPLGGPVPQRQQHGEPDDGQQQESADQGGAHGGAFRQRPPRWSRPAWGRAWPHSASTAATPPARRA